MTALERANGRLGLALLDELNVADDGSATGRKYVTGAESYLAGHFPSAPIVPGMFIVDMLAAVASATLDTGSGGPALRRVSHFRFLCPVEPGDLLELGVQRLSGRDDGAWFAAQAAVAGCVVASGRLLL